MQTEQSKVNSTIQELRQAQNMVDAVNQALENQKQILKQRGMNLPPMVSLTLQQIRTDLGKLEDSLKDEHGELEQLRALANMSANINTSLDVDAVLRETMDVVIALTKADRGYIILINEDTGALDYRISREDGVVASTGKTPSQVSSTVLREVTTKGQPLLADNAYRDSRLEHNESIAGIALRSVLCVPLIYKDEIMGAVYVDNRLMSGIFTEREKNTLTAFANTAAVAIANARLFSEVRETLNEITQVKNLMDNVFESIGSGLIATDAQDAISTFNRAAEEILEISAKDTIGQTLQSILPRITADLQEHLARIRENAASESIESDIANTKGERLYVSLKLSPLRDKYNQTSGVAVVMDDLTEKRDREQQLHIMKTYLPPEMVDKIHEISRLALGGERRQVTCLFAEVRSLYTMRDVRPSEIMDILNTFFNVATQCIHDTQGVVDKYMGTEVMSIWNTQLSPQENHAVLAVESALLMRDRFIELYQQLGLNPEPHFYRIGMHTGVATMGNVGSLNRRDFTAIGDTINLSKRLEENAVRGQIIISEETLQHIQHSQSSIPYRFEELPALQVKGRQQKTRIYEVFRENA